MSRREEYEQKAEELITPIVEANGFELVDVEYVKEGGTWYLRAYIDKEGGITVDDCWTQRTLSMTPISWRSAPRVLDVR